MLVKKEIKDLAILKAAEVEFLNRGFEGAVMESIAKQAEVSKRTLYKYYPTKDDLYGSLVEKLFASAEEAMVYPYQSDDSLEEMFKGIISKKFDLLNNSGFIKLAKIIAVEQMRKQEPDQDFLKRIEVNHSDFSKWVKKCQKDGKLNTDFKADEISNWFHSIFEGMVMWPLIMGIKNEINKKDLESSSHLISQTFLKTFSK